MDLNLKHLPKYSFKDEIWNAITHGIGFLFSIGIFVFFIIKNATTEMTFIKMLPFYVYAFSMLVVFLVSTLYHTSRFETKYRAVLRMIDHSDIYFFVAGTYLPLAIYGITPWPIALAIIIVQFSMCLYGILCNSIPNNSKFLKATAYAVYIVQGWLILFFLPFGAKLNLNVFLYILIGGVVYSIGAITYTIGKKKIYFHTIFHAFVVIAAAIQFIGIYNLL